ncbi:hypothetical protein H696_03163 [Fonticula alba]|uniref:Uncharacterized protein n=1 Tax=Fonticula alba TaxID=691883 RepID=A0A058ZBK9_FONAL|nr:hypothetical protein H696_03163 [Fonticula alba]KCV70812.1 hypothetical protein H696_03163 [Fonticula alba]|eukprot:XP_009495328.1 hypothetical protein H696_03163 [Fonticula alba]
MRLTVASAAALGPAPPATTPLFVCVCAFRPHLSLLFPPFSLFIMGAGSQFPYPKWVWSPSGGWWTHQPHWVRNTAIVYGLAAVFIIYPCYRFSKNNEVRYNQRELPKPYVVE